MDWNGGTDYGMDFGISVNWMTALALFHLFHNVCQLHLSLSLR